MPVQQIAASQSRLGDAQLLAELKAGLLGTAAKLHLFRSDFAPGPDTDEAAFEAAEADFNTYAATAIVWGAVTVGLDGNPVMRATGVTFTNVAGTTATPGGDSIGGAWVHIDDVGPPIVDVPAFFAAFSGPLDVAAAGKSFVVDVVMRVGPDGPYVVLET